MDTPEQSDIEYAAAQENHHLNIPEEWGEAPRDQEIRDVNGPFWGAWLKKQKKGFCNDQNCPVKQGARNV